MTWPEGPTGDEGPPTGKDLEAECLEVRARCGGWAQWRGGCGCCGVLWGLLNADD